MLTEQEVMAYLNRKIAKNELKPGVQKYIDKLKKLEEILSTQTKSLTEMHDKVKALELDVQRIRGAISVIIEMAAEEEGLLTDLPEKSQ
jgi:uncharacterized coiled-coil protein SlyX